MKILILTVILLCSHAWAFESHENDELVCEATDSYGNHSQAISCVSRASIEKDKAELKLIKLQIKKLEAEIKAEKAQNNGPSLDICDIDPKNTVCKKAPK